MILAPFLANTFGWIFTEMGRQPWVVYGLMLTKNGVSPFGTGYVATSLIGFTALYSLLAVVEMSLMWTVARRDLPELEPEGEGPPEAPSSDRPLELVY